MPEKYESDSWSPVTIKISAKKKLSNFKNEKESWTEVIERLLTIAKEKGKTK